MVGPAVPGAGGPKKKGLKFESVYLDHMPKADMYEKSYMHRDEVNRVLVTPKYAFHRCSYLPFAFPRAYTVDR